MTTAREKREPIHGQWSGRWAFILAATGSAVGLGNIWKFPYITGEYGGGAFVLVYLACVALIGIPVMMAEVMLGRRGRRSPINTMRFLAHEEGRSPLWKYLGWSGVIAGFLILSYYSVIAGWALAYIFRSAAGMFDNATADGVGAIFGDFVSSPERLLAWHTIFMVMTMTVVARGVRNGLETAVRWMMPALFLILLVLDGYALNSGYFDKGVDFMFKADFHRLTGEGILIAMGHAFFTLSLGMGAIMVYGSYLPEKTSIAKTSVIIAFADTLVAILAGLAIFPLVFANGLEPGSGPGLIFKTLPYAFGHMPVGHLFGALFFLLLTFAAWSSAISLVEPAVAWLVENHGFSRVRATAWIGVITWLVGLLTVFSFNLMSGKEFQFFYECKIVGGAEKCGGLTVFDLLDHLTAGWMLPLGGLGIAVFVAWQMRRSSVLDELRVKDSLLFRSWYVVLSFVTPLAIVAVFLNVIGVLPWLLRLVGIEYGGK